MIYQARLLLDPVWELQFEIYTLKKSHGPELFNVVSVLALHVCVPASYTTSVCTCILNFIRVCEKIQFKYILRRSENSILTLMIIFRVKINVAIHIEPRNGVKIFKKWVLGVSIFTQNLTRPPLRQKKNILKYRVYCIQKNRLCNTVSTKQSVN